MQLNLIDTYTTSLGTLYTRIRECKLCPYHLLSHNTVRVVGRGNVGSRLMIVGQGPGEAEITSGVPFSGSSGKLLKKIMRSVGLEYNDCYATNMIRCMQPKGGKPILDSCIKKCKVWLDDEVGIVKPELIVCVGGISTEYLLGYKLEDSGSIVNSIYNIPGIGTYHPAYILRLKNYKSTEDSKKEEYNRVTKLVIEQWKLIAGMVGIGEHNVQS